MQTVQQEVLDRYKKLPKELQDAMFSEETTDTVFNIGQRHGLLIDKIGEMATEIGFLILGKTHPDSFVGNLAKRLGIDATIASKIADDINREIFAPVREHLHALHGSSFETPTQAPTFSPSPTPTPVSQKPMSLFDKTLKEGGGDETTKHEATLEDLKKELESFTAKESGIQKPSLGDRVKKQDIPIPMPQTPKPHYKGFDPYKEHIEEDAPIKKESARETRVPFSIGRDAIGGKPVEQKKPPIPVPEPPKASPRTGAFGVPSKNNETHSPFSPLPTRPVIKPAIPEKTPVVPKPMSRAPAPTQQTEKTNTLPAFHGFRMNTAPDGLSPGSFIHKTPQGTVKKQEVSHTTETIKPIERPPLGKEMWVPKTPAADEQPVPLTPKGREGNLLRGR